MSLDYRHETLDGFPRQLLKAQDRDYSRFGKTWKQVQEILARELRMLNYRDGSVILQTAHTPYNLRNDGKLRSDARSPEHPGVVLKFDVFNSPKKRYEQMSFECDQFDDWKANVRAIADALEALRKVDRYGVTGGGKSDAHYEGYKRLGSEESFDIDIAIEFLFIHSAYTREAIRQKMDIFLDAYKQAALKLHPDMPTGSHELFIRLQKAKEILLKHFG